MDMSLVHKVEMYQEDEDCRGGKVQLGMVGFPLAEVCKVWMGSGDSASSDSSCIGDV